MTYPELVKKVQTALKKADASAVAEHIAAQVNVTGEAEGAFYIEIIDGTIKAEPYDYNDRDFLLTADEAEILAVAQGKKTLESAIVEGAIAHEGDWEKTLTLGSVIPAAKKPGRKPKTEESAPAPVEEAPVKEEAPAPVEEAPAPAPVEEQLPLTGEAPAPAPAETKPKSKSAEKPKTTRKTTAKTDEKPVAKKNNSSRRRNSK